MKLSTVAVLSLLALVACSSSTAGPSTTTTGTHPSGEAALRRVLSAYCDRLEECNPSGFATAYPDGQTSCVEKGTSALSDTSKAAPGRCTSAELDTCVTDVNGATCAAITSGTEGLPATCSVC
jgi:hypothetical protein